MKRGTVLDLKRYNGIIEFIKVNKTLIILTIFFILGLSFGIFFLNSFEPLGKFAESYLNDYIEKRTQNGFFGIAFDSFLSSMLFLAISFICGSSMLGIILLPINVSANGFLYGILASLLYSEYSLNGVAFYAVMILPAAIVSIIALLLASKESIKFSLLLARLTIKTTAPLNLSYDFKNFCGRYLTFSFICLISSIIDAILSTNFLKSFSI